MKPGLFHYRVELESAKGQWTTILDRSESTEDLHSIAQSLTDITDASAAALAAETGARAALEHFQPLPCKIGRARLFPKKSTGAHDPGMLALWLLLMRDDFGMGSAQEVTPFLLGARDGAQGCDARPLVVFAHQARPSNGLISAKPPPETSLSRARKNPKNIRVFSLV